MFQKALFFKLLLFINLVPLLAHAAIPKDDPEYFTKAKACAVPLLEEGLRTYAAEAQSYMLDSATSGDLRLKYLLYPVLNKTRTQVGAIRLATLLANPYLDIAEIKDRQSALAELLENAELGKTVTAHLDWLKEVTSSNLLENFLGHDYYHRRWIPGSMVGRVLGSLFSPAVLSGSIAATAVAMGAPQLALAGPVISVSFSAARVEPMKAIANARAWLLQYKKVFEFAGALAEPLKKSNSTKLQEIGDIFDAVNNPKHALGLFQAVQKIKKVTKKTAIGALDFLYDHSAYTLRKPQQALIDSKEKIAVLFGAIAELDVYLALADASKSLPGHSVFPVILDQPENTVQIEDGHNPFVLSQKGERSVANNVTLDEKTNFFVLTGANMGGKSTYLKMIAMMTVQAQIGGKVWARGMVLTPLELKTAIDIPDSIEEGKSFFDAETNRILELIERAKKEEKLLVIMDEILLGTNPEERAAAEKAVIDYLRKTGKLFLLATHDMQMAELEGNIPGVGNMHVEEFFEDGKMKFSYQVKPGPATSRNAIRVLEMKGFPEEITKSAWANLEGEKEGD